MTDPDDRQPEASPGGHGDHPPTAPAAPALPAVPPTAHAAIALKAENCTSCLLCVRECPDWCITLDFHKETEPPSPGGRERWTKVLDRFEIDFGACMYCGICVDVCPFDALFWSPAHDYAGTGQDAVAQLRRDEAGLAQFLTSAPGVAVPSGPAREPAEAETAPAAGDPGATGAASAPAPAAADPSATEAVPAAPQRANPFANVRPRRR